MAVSKRVLKELPCKYKEGDMFTDGNTFYTVTKVITRDEFRALLKEPRYTMKRNPDEIMRNGEVFLKLYDVDMLESQIDKLTGLTWTKVN